MELDFDSPFSSLSHKSPSPAHRSRKTTSFQEELQASLKQRHQRGLSHDISEDEALGSDDDLLSDFNVTMKPQNRPGSATRRESPVNTNQMTAEEIIEARQRETELQKRTQMGKKTQEQSPRQLTKEEIIFGSKSPSRTSPVSQSLRRSPSPLTLPKKSSRNPDKDEEVIAPKQKWQPPSFRKSPALDEASPGRQMSSGLLQNINDSPKVTPRTKSSSFDKEKEEDMPTPRLRKVNGEEEKTSVDHTKPKPKERRFPSSKTPSPDIFKKSGGHHSFLDDSDEDNAKPKVKAREKNNKLPYSARKSPVKEEKSEVKQVKKETSLLDLIGGGPDEKKKKDSAVETPKPRKQRLKKAVSHDSITEEIEKHGSRSTSPTKEDDSRSRQSSPLSRASSKKVTPTSSLRSSPKQDSSAHRSRRSNATNVLETSPETIQTDKSKMESETNEDVHHVRESSICREVKEDPEREKWQNHAHQEIEEIDKDKGCKPQRQIRQQADDAIDAIAENNKETMRFIDPHEDSTKKKDHKVETKSANKQKKLRPKPRYGKPALSDLAPASNRSYDCASSIRESIFEDWYKEKMKKSKAELNEKKQKEKQEEERKIKAKDEKLKEAELSYKSWMSQRSDSWVKDKKSANKKQRDEEKKKQEDIDSKTKVAEMTYRVWKDNKDAKIVEKKKEEKKIVKKKDEELNQTKSIKHKESANAYESWKSKKDNIITTQKKEIKKSQKVAKKTELVVQQKKDDEAVDSYTKWMEKKEKLKSLQKRQSRSLSSLDDEPRQAWSPAGRTIPRGR